MIDRADDAQRIRNLRKELAEDAESKGYERGRVLPILIHPDHRLNTRCEAVTEITPDLQQLAADMLETMYDVKGIGLAAPQIGVLKRLIVMDCKRSEATDPVVMFNPVVMTTSRSKMVWNEGCLSIPGYFAKIKRPTKVTVLWTDLQGVARLSDFVGLWAICVQHEIDHLNGKLIIEVPHA